ncbi:DUF4097 family beta strand repeat-containing protein [Salinibaculum rarum]|uniref:DUF4097 family beta strand repeat-containing protein n=1 Tax=Salinibaculum rarum TaxID=3058903 RepID=UPI00265E0AE6|nr:DUF4097 family beta strand repeat-containing protein [Salinibaculum sp. KK48]
MRRRTLLAGVGTVTTAGLAGCFGAVFETTASESFENTYDVRAETTLTVSNRNGNVSVRNTDDDQLTVAGEKRASSESALEELSVDVTTGERVVVDVSFGPGSNFDQRSVDVSIDVPTGVTVDRVETSNGNVTVTGVTGDVSASTSNGNVWATDVDGSVDCDSSNGNVRIRGATGVASARTSNGTVDVELLAMDGDVTCESSNGGVTIRIGPDISCAFELSTSNGRVSVEDVPHTASVSRRGRMEGRIRDGTDPTLTAATTNGDVRLQSAES